MSEVLLITYFIHDDLADFVNQNHDFAAKNCTHFLTVFIWYIYVYSNKSLILTVVYIELRNLKNFKRKGK